MALSPSILTKSYEAAKSLSKFVAVTVSDLFSAKRREVSFTTAKASGIISNNTASDFSYAVRFSASIVL